MKTTVTFFALEMSKPDGENRRVWCYSYHPSVAHAKKYLEEGRVFGYAEESIEERTMTIHELCTFLNDLHDVD